MFCTNCGRNLSGKEAFCPSCGQKISYGNSGRAQNNGQQQYSGQGSYGSGNGAQQQYGGQSSYRSGNGQQQYGGQSSYGSGYGQQQYGGQGSYGNGQQQYSGQSSYGNRSGAQYNGQSSYGNENRQQQYGGQNSYGSGAGNSGGYGSGAGSNGNGGGNNSGLVTLVRAAAFVLAVPVVIWALLNLGGILLGTGSALRNMLVSGVLTTVCRLLRFVGSLVFAAVLVLFGLFLNQEENNAEPLLLTVIGGALIRLVLQFIAALVALAAYSAASSALYRYKAFRFGDLLWSLVYMLAAAAILLGLSFLAGFRPFAGITGEELGREIRTLPDFLQAEIEIFAARRQSAKGGNGAGAERGQGADAQTVRPMNEKRGVIKYLLLTIVTCFVYTFYFVYSVAQDVNEACKGDGEETAGLIKYILFSLITCGIYSFVWYYKFLTRIENASRHYGYETRTIGNMSLGSCYLMTLIVGALTCWLCGIGAILSLYGQYLMFQNLNAMARNYNQRMGVSPK